MQEVHHKKKNHTFYSSRQEKTLYCLNYILILTLLKGMDNGGTLHTQAFVRMEISKTRKRE